MTGLGWAALGCYVFGAIVAGAGLVLAFREAQAIGRALDEMATARMPSASSGGQPIPPGEVNNFNTPHILRVALAMAGNKGQRWRAFLLIVTGGVVELAGNLFSLPW